MTGFHWMIIVGFAITILSISSVHSVAVKLLEELQEMKEKMGFDVDSMFD